MNELINYILSIGYKYSHRTEPTNFHYINELKHELIYDDYKNMIKIGKNYCSKVNDLKNELNKMENNEIFKIVISKNESGDISFKHESHDISLFEKLGLLEYLKLILLKTDSNEIKNELTK